MCFFGGGGGGGSAQASAPAPRPAETPKPWNAGMTRPFFNMNSDGGREQADNWARGERERYISWSMANYKAPESTVMGETDQQSQAATKRTVLY
jgi:hypothetical protein